VNKLHDVILEVISFPEIYLGKRSVEKLEAFLHGYLYQNNEVNDSSLDGFTDFVAQKHRITTDHNWASIIRFFSVDERDAFDSFIKLYNEFCSTRKIKATL
jgi:hypothetical protein